VKRLAGALLAACIAAVPAQAIVVDFEDLAGMGVLSSSYAGINWGDNWRYFDAVQAPYTPASGRQRIYRNYSVWGVGAADIPFTFSTDVIFSGAWLSGYADNQVTFKLFNNGNLVHTSGAFAPSSIPTFAASGYGGVVDEVRVSGRQIVTLDNITYALPGGIGGETDTPFGPVPEPASWAMLIAGFGLTGAAMRRRRAAIA
jgi:hypothetical protein